MGSRYFLDHPPNGEQATLTGSEAHHLAHVLRAKPGEEVTLFDGSGREYRAVVEKVRRSEVQLSVREARSISREAGRAVTLAVALPKGDRQRWLAEKAVEIGVARLIPLETARGVAQPGENALERLRRSVIEASKQCGRNHLMEVAAATPWDALVATAADEPHRMVAHPGGSQDAAAAQLAQLPPSAPVLLAVGPEGGFTDEEIAAATAAGWQTVELGSRILRVETAALVLAALAIHGAAGST